MDKNSSTIGVDISSYQGNVDMEKLKEQNIKFVYIKATEGSSHQDEMFAANWDNAKKAGILTARIISSLMTVRAVIRRRTLSKLSEKAPDDWYIWQYLNRGTLEGYSGGEKHIDLNVLNKEKNLNDLIVK